MQIPKLLTVSNPPPLIAVIDDEEPVRVALTRLLRSAGMLCSTHSSAESFLASVTSNPPDCMVLDVQMPVMDGFRLYETLIDSGVSIPVVFVSGNDASQVPAISQNAAVRFLRKPLDGQVLIDAIVDSLTETQV